VALCLLLATYWRLPSARDGVRRTAVAFLIGDLALWSAVGLIAASRGTVDLRALQAEQLSGPIVALAACLVVVAALSRSAQIPFHRWLPATLAAPTPVSALLHAGVVNAGGVLLIKLSPLATAVGLAQALTIVAGIATLAYGAVVMLVKPDVKGALAYSTMAQMGFMILTCGLGLWAAAVFHLVAHGFYKATLFLSSGSAIAYRRRVRALPPAAPRTRGAIPALLLPAGALALALTVVPMGPGDHTAEWALLLFAWVTGATATKGWLTRRPGAGGVFTAAAFLLPANLGYVWLVAAVSGFLAPSLPAPALPTTATWLITGSALAILGGLAAAVRAAGAGRLRRALYARALNAGHIAAPPSSLPTRLTGARP
jgi:NAD(P)H-quinone oxidoreductase subunit 5